MRNRTLLPIIAACACGAALGALAAGCSWARAYQSRVIAEEAFASGAEAAQQGDLERARQEFDRALRRAPHLASLHARIGLAYAEMQPPQQRLALAHLRRAIDLDPLQPFPVYLHSILVAAQLRREDVARNLLRQAARRFHHDALALNDIGYLLADADKLTADALPLLERAVALRPKSGIILDSLGWAHYRLGNLERAEALLEHASDLAPKNAEIEYHLGVVYADRGRTEDAQAQFRRALQVDPRFAPARAALRRLERRQAPQL